MFKTLTLCLLTVLSITEYTSAHLTLSNPSFEAQVLDKEEQSDVNDISGWEASGQSYVQYLNPNNWINTLKPHAQDGNNTCILNEATDEPIYIQQVVIDGNYPATVEANKSYQVSVWIGRLQDTLDPNVGTLEVYFKEAETNNKIAQATYDLSDQHPRFWTFRTFTLSTGNRPLGHGSNLILGFENIGIRNKNNPEHRWQGQVVLDDISITLFDPIIVYVTDTQPINTDGIPNDQRWIDWLITEGYGVDVKPNYWVESLDPNQQAELKDAHLIIAGPGMNPDYYNDPGEANIWNSIGTPMLNLNTHLLRKNLWNWIDANNVVEDTGFPLMEFQDPNHPVFSDLTTDENSLVDIWDANAPSGYTSFLDNVPDTGNGTLLARALGVYDTAWIAEWKDGMEFYEGAGQFAGGHRIMFMMGNQDVSSGLLGFSLNDTGQTILHNTINYLISKKKSGPVLELTFDDGNGVDTSGHHRDVEFFNDAKVVDDPERGMVLKLSGTGYASLALENNGDLRCRNSVTVAFWIKEDPEEFPIPFQYGIFGNGFSLNMGHAFAVNRSVAFNEDGNIASKSFNWDVRGTASPFTYATSYANSIPSNTWYHMAFTYDNKVGAQIYENGELKKEIKATGGIAEPIESVENGPVQQLNEGGINIGNALAPGDIPLITSPIDTKQLFKGCLDHIIVYDRVLSVDEIATLAGM